MKSFRGRWERAALEVVPLARVFESSDGYSPLCFANGPSPTVVASPKLEVIVKLGNSGNTEVREFIVRAGASQARPVLIQGTCLGLSGNVTIRFSTGFCRSSAKGELFPRIWVSI